MEINSLSRSILILHLQKDLFVLIVIMNGRNSKPGKIAIGHGVILSSAFEVEVLPALTHLNVVSIDRECHLKENKL